MSQTGKHQASVPGGSAGRPARPLTGRAAGNHAGMIARPAEFAARLRGLLCPPASGDSADTGEDTPAYEEVTR